MFRSIKKFTANKRGAFAMQFALMAVPLTICTGLAVDGGRAFLARFELASALDAAALAVGSTLQQQGTDLNAVAAKFVEKNFRTEHSEPIALTLVSHEDTIVLKGTVKINTYFMPLVGQPTVTINAESEVKRGGSNIEVAMALDITGSMNATRMTGLTNAANILVTEVVNPVQTPFFSKIAIVPWSQSISLLSSTSTLPKNVKTAALDELRGGALTGARSISAASWRTAGASNMTISEAGWRTTIGARTIANAANNGTGGIDWRYGSGLTISSFTKVTVNGTNRIRVATSGNHGYADGDFVRITDAGGSFTSLNKNIYHVEYYTSGTGANATNTFYLRLADDTAYAPQPSGSTSSSATSQRCHDAECNVGVTTTADFTGLAAGDFVNITGTSGFPSSQSPNYINNSDTTTWKVEAVPSLRRFTIKSWDGPAFGTNMNSGSGTVSECLEASCRYRVKTGTTNHNFLESEFIAIFGLTEGGSGTSANSDLNTTWKIKDPDKTIFFLPGKGKDYMDWKSGGSAAECQLDTCNTRITVGSITPDRPIKVGDYFEIKSAKGLTGINNTTSSITSPSTPARVSWRISKVDGSVLTLEDSSPAFNNMANAYTNSGTAQCLSYGCAKFDFVVKGGSESNPSNHRVYIASPCLVERYGANAATDVSPATSPLTIYYTSNGTCRQTNYVTPLTSDKQRLLDAVGDLSTGGSTSGQLGIGWAWYLLSPNFGSVWDKDPNQMNVPLSYEAPETAKIAILMTDGEFNYATCNAVNTGTACDPAKSPYSQAEDICAAMKVQDITIYTVGLQLNKAQYGDDFLLKCATSPQHAFLADDNAQLEQAFKDIAVSINRLRISR